jgi:two-component system, OmpR family, sensor histidine kinase CpxA
MKLFLRIFMSFWLATVLMIAAALGVMYILGAPVFTGVERVIQPGQVTADLSLAVDVYERQGRTAFLDQLQKVQIGPSKLLYLFDQQGKVLVESGGTPASSYRQFAEDVLRSGHEEFILNIRRKVFACLVQSSTGHQYAVVLVLSEPRDHFRRPRLWLSLLAGLVPTALICMALSLYLTRPIARLRKTAQRLADGDLDARTMPPGGSMRRRDELGDLARDFDLMAARIQSLMTAQRRFVIDVSHELGSPLTRMHLALALLRRELSGRNGVELQRIEREAGKLNSLVQQLLLLARMEADSCPAETLEAISIRSLCESIIDDAGAEAWHAGCCITGSRDDVTLQIYPQLLRRAIDNVLRNAIRYAPAGTVIRFDCTSDELLQHVLIDIRDQGPGVPEEMLSDIFRPFFRTSQGRDSSSGGTGLGLSIASEAVRLHYGTITAHNQRDGGLKVRIILPMRSPASQPDFDLVVTEGSLRG